MTEHPLAIRHVVVRNAGGMHARPAAMLAKTASRFESTIELIKQGHRVDCRDALQILLLVAEQGCELQVEARGADAEDAAAAVTELFESGFHEEDEEADA